MSFGSLLRLPSIRIIANNNNNNNVLKSVKRLISGVQLQAVGTRYSAACGGGASNRLKVMALEGSILRNNVRMLATTEQTRNISSQQEITKNIFLFTGDGRKVERDQRTLRLKDQQEKPLVIILAWLQAKHKHLKKYAELYTNQGFDVLVTQITPWQLLWPVKGSQLVAADILKFLENNNGYTPMVLHGFSVAGYVWGEVMVHMARELDRYKPLLDKISVQIWDSAADITEIPAGVPKALFPRNPTLQKALRGYMMYHLKTFHDAATVHYIRSSQMFHSTLVNAPALFLVSKTDPIGAVASNQRVRESWESKGIQVTWKCWDRSPHVGHFRKHPEEYVQLMFNHLQTVNLVRNPEKLRAKL